MFISHPAARVEWKLFMDLEALFSNGIQLDERLGTHIQKYSPSSHVLKYRFISLNKARRRKMENKTKPFGGGKSDFSVRS